ncbi:SIR2 family protein [Methanobacterium formicicum]|uniref:Uncharacterized protein n=1 Tax=Methanobacterium formicicum (strain DSM 3637 / PP1) TaxID=1204725 RepID=K2REP8_METFP|nr:SIR2 family protein [Methanobacterium formicicum]EKF86839.1 hypothetical protein A994_01095 [Methanobacterium formicicum DSM 3637]
MAENVIFLGAGASTSKNAPLQSQLFEKYFSLETTSPYEQKMNERLTKFFKDFFAIDVTNNLEEINFPEFEEILGILELSLNREESFKNYGLYHNNPQIQQIKEDLIFLIAITIDKEIKSKPKNKSHEILTKRLIEENEIWQTDFISLNYDIILDNTLTRMHENYDLDLDYGIEFTNFENNYEEDPWKRPLPEKAVHLYKPHGSLNWLYCPTCISTTLTPEEKGAVKLFYEPIDCEVCGSKIIPIIIPPSFFKVMSNRYLQEIWYKMEDSLKNAERIYFCGYSFPDADIHIKYLLKKAEINGNSNPEIYIINNSEKKEIKSSYERFFKCDTVKWTGQSFEHFCKHGL